MKIMHKVLRFWAMSIAALACGGAWALPNATDYSQCDAYRDWSYAYGILNYKNVNSALHAMPVSLIGSDGVTTTDYTLSTSEMPWNDVLGGQTTRDWVLRYAEAGYKESGDAQFTPLTIGGLIVTSLQAEGKPYILLGNKAGNRVTILGSYTTAETLFKFEKSFTVNRNSDSKFIGNVNVDVASGAVFNYNGEQTSYKTVLTATDNCQKPTLRLHGEGQMKVALLEAPASSALDFSDLGTRENANPFIDGALTIAAETELILPEGITEEKPLKLCSGTLTGLNSGTRSVVINGKTTLADLTVVDKAITAVTIQEQMPDVAFKFTGNASGGTIADSSTWFTGWNGEGGDAAKKMVGPDGKGVVPMTFHVDNGTKWHPYRETMTAKDTFTLAAYVNTELSQPTAGKYQVIWCMGWNNAEKTALVKAADGSIQLVHAGTDSQIVKSVTIDAEVVTPGYHLFTATFSTETGISLTIDNNVETKQSDTTATTKAGNGIQIGGVLGNCQGVFELGNSIGIAALVAYDQVLSDNLIKTVALDYPASKNVAVDVNPADNKELIIPSMTVASDKMLGVTHGTLTIPEGATVETPRFKIQNTSSTDNRTTVNIAGTLTMTADNDNKNVWGNDGKGLLFGHWHGQGTYNITGTIDARKTYLETVYTAEMQTINLDGGTVTVKSVYAAKDNNTTFNLKNGGRLNMTATDEVNVPFTNESGENTISVADNQTISKAMTLTAGTLNLEVAADKTLTVSGAVSGEGRIAKKGNGTLHITGTSTSTIVFDGNGVLTSTSDSLNVVTTLEGKGVRHETAEGVTTYMLFEAAASIGENGYASLVDALEAASEGETVKLHAANAETVEIPAGVTVDTAGFDFTGVVSGQGVLKVNSFSRINNTAVQNSLKADAWTGTVKVSGCTAIETDALSGTQTALNNYGNVQSKIEFDNCNGTNKQNYFGLSHDTTPIVVQPEIVVTETLYIGNGYSHASNTPNSYTIFRKLSGTGTLSCANASQLFYILDGTGFTGSIVSMTKKFVFGERNADSDSAAAIGNGEVVIRSAAAAPAVAANWLVGKVTIEENQTLTVDSSADIKIRHVVGGTLVKRGSGKLMIQNENNYAIEGATVSVEAGTVEVNCEDKGDAKIKDAKFVIGEDASAKLDNYGYFTVEGSLTIENATDKTVFTNRGANSSKIWGADQTFIKEGAGKLTLQCTFDNAAAPQSAKINGGSLVVKEALPESGVTTDVVGKRVKLEGLTYSLEDIPAPGPAESGISADATTGKPQLTITGAAASTDVTVVVTAGDVEKTYTGTTDASGSVTIPLSGDAGELAPGTAYVYTATTGSGDAKTEIATGAFITDNAYFSASVADDAAVLVNGSWGETAPSVAEGAFALTDAATFTIADKTPAAGKTVTVTQTLTIESAIDVASLGEGDVSGAVGAIAIVEGTSGNEWRVLGDEGAWVVASGTVPELPATFVLTMTHDPLAKTFNYVVKTTDGLTTYLNAVSGTQIQTMSSVSYYGSGVLAQLEGVLGTEVQPLEEGYLGIDEEKKLPIILDSAYAAALGSTHAEIQGALNAAASAGLKTWQAYLLGVDSDELASIDLTARFAEGATENSLTFADGYAARTDAGSRVRRTVLVGPTRDALTAVESTRETSETVTITLPTPASSVNFFQIRYDFE